ncbi:MAG: hypothetical protein ACLVFG_04970 [Lachnospiraceae bacterium]
MMQEFKYALERSYPYWVSGIIVLECYKLSYNWAGSSNMPNAIEGIITVATLIIGFIGAMLPVLLSTQKDSEFVKDVLTNDKKHLMLKYLKAMLLTGLLLIVFSVMMNFSQEIEGGFLDKYGFYVWIFLVSCFVLTTYRCISRMLRLVFEDGVKIQGKNKTIEKTEREKKYEQKWRKTGEESSAKK